MFTFRVVFVAVVVEPVRDPLPHVAGHLVNAEGTGPAGVRADSGSLAEVGLP